YSTGAVYRVENQLSYKIGKILINTKDIKSILKAPIEIIMSVLEHKRKSKIYQTLVNIDKKYAMPPLESYSDFYEALRLKEHLTYKLGKSFLDNPYVFIFKVKKIYKEWKNNKGV
ncbi:sugar transferase, partial [Campylobacter jejuni]|nr:sugar transferase [Campylobacter jejuni]